MHECGKDMTIPPEMESFLATCTNLPSLPSVVVKIIDASKDPDISLTDMADIIKVDPALSAKLLKVANSSMYSSRRKLTSLRDSLALLGLNASIIIALSFSLVKSLNCRADNSLNYDEFWKRSILSATIARLIGIKFKLPNLEDIFLASLLQDIGILAIDSSNKHQLPQSLSENHALRVNTEKKTLGVDHSDIGAWLLKSWNLPEKLYRAVLCSHIAFKQTVENDEEATFNQCVSMSGKLADIWFDCDREQAILYNFKSIEALGLADLNKAAFNDFINEIDAALPEVSSLFDMKIADDASRDQVINEAREILMERNIKIIKQFDDHRKQIESLTERSRDIEEEANRDHLTRAFNRKYIEKLLQEEFKASSLDQRPLSLAFIDIDNFKPINDSYGHLAGDKVLQEIAHFFNRQFRQTDIFARYGGDEFLLMLPNTDAKTATILLNRLINKLNDSAGTEFEDRFIKVTLSVGVATQTSKTDFGNLADLIHAADKALYSAKETGKNRLMSF